MIVKDFDGLICLLGNAGYHIRVTKHKDGDDNYRFAFIENSKGIIAGFCTENTSSYKYINNRIAADNADCFDKWSKCPLVMRFPLDGDILLKHLNWLATEDGYKHSLYYEYLENRILPYEINEIDLKE